MEIIDPLDPVVHIESLGLVLFRYKVIDDE